MNVNISDPTTLSSQTQHGEYRQNIPNFHPFFFKVNLKSKLTYLIFLMHISGLIMYFVNNLLTRKS